MTVTPQIAIPLIVCKDDNEIRARLGIRIIAGGCKQKTNHHYSDFAAKNADRFKTGNRRNHLAIEFEILKVKNIAVKCFVVLSFKLEVYGANPVWRQVQTVTG
ncbi:MAG TPA: hypothetical protein VE467_17060, partial [Chryseolinea sp.]|nr:hypothetical protein [Chryseolinea sp.]